MAFFVNPGRGPERNPIQCIPLQSIQMRSIALFTIGLRHRLDCGAAAPQRWAGAGRAVAGGSGRREKGGGEGWLSPAFAARYYSLRPRAVSERRKASPYGLAEKTLQHFSQMKAPGRHGAGRVSVARPCIYPDRPSCGAGGAGLLGPGVCGLGGADTLNIGYSLWQDCPCIVPPRVSSDTSAADEGAASQHSFRTTGFQPFPP